MWQAFSCSDEKALFLSSFVMELIAIVIAPFPITINSNVCPHIRVLNTLMRESYA